MHSTSHNASLPLVIIAGVSLFITVPRAQTPSAGAPAAPFVGGWSLNKEQSSAPPTAGTRGSGDGSGGRRGRGVFGGPRGGGGGMGRRGMGGGGFGGPGGRGQMDPEQMRARMELTREVMRPTPHWVITSDGDVLTFADADGRSTKYTINDKKEKHQLTGGTIETKSRWDNGQLMQELSLPGGMKMKRAFSLESGDVPRLIVTLTPEGEGSGRPGGDGAGGSGGRRAPLKFVYDRDVQ